ncbi:MAG: hydrophobe/amphiphile efflux-3 (HAE3) family transporter [Actinomycetia bacterium]|nr:hydrophobe/amphiphile efflux-3 (HAE3) family transporter [Actinomycetes bacterium]
MKIAAFVGRIVERHAPAILVVVLILIGLASWSVGKTSIVTTQDAFISPDSEAFLGYQAYEEAFGGDSMMILIPGTPLELATPEALRGFTELEARLSAEPRIASIVSPLTLLAPAAAQGGVDLDDPGSLLQAALEDESLRTQLERFFPKNHALVVVRLAGGLIPDEQVEVAQFIRETVAANPLGADAIVAGTPLLAADVKSAITSDLVRTGVIAVILMVLILFVVFPVRWRLLSLPMVLVGVLWTFGLIAAIDIPLTLVTLGCLPVLIGLGVDFAVQFHNRYEEEMYRGETRAEAIVESISHISPAVGAAVIAMVLGFITLLMSAIPAVRDFGVVLAIGAAVLYATALFVLNAILYRFDRQPRTTAAPVSGAPVSAAPAPQEGPDGGAAAPAAPHPSGSRPARPGLPSAWRSTVTRIRSLLGRDWLRIGATLPRVAGWSRRHALWVVSAAVVVAVVGFVADRDLTVQTEVEKLIPTNTPGVVALEEARSVVGGSIQLPFLIHAQDVTAPSVVHWMADFQARVLGAHPELVGVNSLTETLGVKPGDKIPSPQAITAALAELPTPIRDALITPDRANASMAFTVTEMPIAGLNQLIDDLMAEANVPAGVTLTPGGTVTLAARAVEATTKNRGLLTGLGIIVVLLGLLAIYRNWRRALIAVIPIVLVTGWSSALMWVAGVDLNPLTAVLGSLVIAIGTEFTVLLLSRYWEERSKGVDHDLAMGEAVAKVGRAITASALTVAAGFGALIFSSFPALRDFGIVTVIDVLFALIVTVTVVPSLVHWLDRGRIRPAGDEG